MAFEKLLASAQNNDLKNELERFKSNPNYNGFSFEETLNTIGYTFLNNYNNIEKAIEVFKLNTQEYPNSSNTYDSLGEAYFKSEDFKLSLLNYQKSYDLDANNKNAVKMIEKLKNKLE